MPSASGARSASTPCVRLAPEAARRYRGGRGGPQPVPARLVGLFPLREHRPSPGEDQDLCARASRLCLWPTATSGVGTTGGGRWSTAHPIKSGLINLNGTVVAPRPGRPWSRRHRIPPVKEVGEPGAGEPHARFDEAAGGDQASRAIMRRTAQAPPADPTLNLRSVASEIRTLGEPGTRRRLRHGQRQLQRRKLAIFSLCFA